MFGALDIGHVPQIGRIFTRFVPLSANGPDQLILHDAGCLIAFSQLNVEPLVQVDNRVTNPKKYKYRGDVQRVR